MADSKRWLVFVALAAACGGASQDGGEEADDTTAGSSTDGGSTGEESGDETGDETGTTTGGNQAECSMYEQDCADGEKCSWKVVGTEITQVCMTVTGSQQIGDPCTHDGVFFGTDDCDETGFCYGAVVIGPGWNGICQSFCGGNEEDPTCDEPSFVCSRGDLPACLPGCDPLVQDCDGADICWYQDDIPGFVCAPTNDMSAIGETCLVPFDCRKGATCQPGSLVPGCPGDECCTEFCDVNDANTCQLAGMGAECVHLGVDGEFANVGACMLPDG